VAASARYEIALAGGYAVQAHGIGNRPSGDVDLFTTRQHGTGGSVTGNDLPLFTENFAAGYAKGIFLRGG
jgi:hypothetical protein